MRRSRESLIGTTHENLECVSFAAELSKNGKPVTKLTVRCTAETERCVGKFTMDLGNWGRTGSCQPCAAVIRQRAAITPTRSSKHAARDLKRSEERMAERDGEDQRYARHLADLDGLPPPPHPHECNDLTCPECHARRRYSDDRFAGWLGSWVTRPESNDAGLRRMEQDRLARLARWRAARASGD